MKKILKQILKYISVLLLFACFGTLALALTYQLPINQIRENAMTSCEYFKTDDTYPKVIADYDDTRLDFWTDSIMVLMSASHSNEGGGTFKFIKKFVYFY